MKIIFAATLFLTLFAGSLRAAEVDPNAVIQKISDAAKSGDRAATAKAAGEASDAQIEKLMELVQAGEIRVEAVEIHAQVGEGEVPFSILLEKTDSGWKATKLTGLAEPGDIVLAFVKAVVAMDEKTILALTHPDEADEAKEMIKELREHPEELKGLSDFRIGKVEIEGDEAEVQLLYKMDGEAEDDEIELVRVDGQWYIADF